MRDRLWYVEIREDICDPDSILLIAYFAFSLLPSQPDDIESSVAQTIFLMVTPRCDTTAFCFVQILICNLDPTFDRHHL